MQITFHGAARTVTGSRHLVSLNGHHLLLDCGLFQGRRKETYERNLRLPFEAAAVDAVVLSHAHLDHCGNLPNLVRSGFSGPIHATHVTVHLTDLLTQDAAHIQEHDAAFLNRRPSRQGQPPVEPLYTLQDALQANAQLRPQAYSIPFGPTPGAQATLVEAGHILGSAGVVLELEERGRQVSLMFSGDIGRPDLPIVPDPVLPHDVDYLIMECTYGDRAHGSSQQAYDSLRSLVRRTAERGGKVIIPSFAVGRTQTLVYYLHQMVDAGELQPIPIFVDSPLAVSVTDVFRRHPEGFDPETRAFMDQDPHGSAFGFDQLTYTRSVEESKALNTLEGPAVIISASGMAESGRILHHLRNHIGEPKNTVLITSWMAPHTLGRRLAEGQKQVSIFGEEHQVRAEVASLDGLSAHGGQPYLLEYAAALKGRVKRIFLVHGEPGPAAVLQEKLEGQGFAVSYPQQGDSFDL
jgi:metallo-beta-lactamase family protein